MKARPGQALVEFALILPIALLIALLLFAASLVWAQWSVARMGAYSLCEYVAQTSDIPGRWEARLRVSIPVPYFRFQIDLPPAQGGISVAMVGRSTRLVATYRSVASGGFAGYEVVNYEWISNEQIRKVICRLSADFNISVPMLGRMGVTSSETFVVESRWH